MKRRWLGAIGCALLLLSGCGMVDELFDAADGGLPAAQISTLPAETEAVQAAPMYSGEEPAYLWGREQLSPDGQAAYDALCAAVAAYQEEPVTVSAGEEDIRQALTAVRIDHPEYFWFDGEMAYVITTPPGMPSYTECTLSYTLSYGEIPTAHAQVEAYTAACMESLLGAQTDYEKILGVYRYIIEHTDYVLSEPDQSIISAMAGHQATCAGYARSFQYLMNRLDIPCVLALGEGASGESHGWNMVMCGGSWYQIDVTWGDPVDADGQPGDSIQYTYCLVTDEEIYRDHVLICDLAMPECTATAYNYFRMVGRLFSQWDQNAYAYAMKAAAEGGERWFSIRCADEGVYAAAKEALFEQGGIWDALREAGAETGDSRVVYTQNEMFYDISVQLAP